jgi:hypothetical protein
LMSNTNTVLGKPDRMLKRRAEDVEIEWSKCEGYCLLTARAWRNKPLEINNPAQPTDPGRFFHRETYFYPLAPVHPNLLPAEPYYPSAYELTHRHPHFPPPCSPGFYPIPPPFQLPAFYPFQSHEVFPPPAAAVPPDSGVPKGSLWIFDGTTHPSPQSPIDSFSMISSPAAPVGLIWIPSNSVFNGTFQNKSWRKPRRVL